MRTVTAVIQARMESTRFPNKMTSDIAGKQALQRVIERVQLARSIDKIIVATANTKDNKDIAKICKKLKIKCFMGNMDDVLQRVIDSVADQPEDSIIVDVTGDCPLVDPDHIDWCIGKVLGGNDYASNVHPRTWPDGFDVQVYTKTILKYISGFVVDPKHRSHVGWNIPNYHKLARYKIKIANLPAPQGYKLPQLGLTLDEEEDRQLISKIYEHFDGKGKGGFTAVNVVDYLFANPELLKINSKIKRKVPGMG
jgi:spore coat polysaccharide biosynthesis protein SpsF